MTMIGNRLEGEWIDAVLHLMDRQVLDVEGRMVCKVDDLEITLDSLGGPPAVTRILAGPAALLPRMSGRTGHWLRRRWISLGVQQAHRDVPLAVSLDHIRQLGSAVELLVAREGLLDRQPRAAPGFTHRRMGELLGMEVRTEQGDQLGRLLDVRLRANPGRFPLGHLVIGPGHPGSMLGYDRGDFNGPWLVQRAVGLLHRRVGLLDWSAVADIDWHNGGVVVTERPKPLTDLDDERRRTR